MIYLKAIAAKGTVESRRRKVKCENFVLSEFTIVIREKADVSSVSPSYDCGNFTLISFLDSNFSFLAATTIFVLAFLSIREVSKVDFLLSICQRYYVTQMSVRVPSACVCHIWHHTHTHTHRKMLFLILTGFFTS